MSAKHSLLLLGLILAGCGLRAPTATSLPAAAPTLTPAVTANAQLSTATLAPSPTAAASPTPTLAKITITAAKGNLFIRRGPDTAFNQVSVLMKGQSATALARDVLATWVEIPLPAQPDKTGWVSIQTQYSAVSGDVQSLPELLPTEWPVLASIRNCTFHQMVTDPGGIVLPSLINFPANDVTVDPGIYRVLDADVDGFPEVAKVELREGVTIDIRDDAVGNHRKCPEP